MFSNTATFVLRILDWDGKEVCTVEDITNRPFESLIYYEIDSKSITGPFVPFSKPFQRDVHDAIDRKSIVGPFVPFDDESRWFYPAGTMELRKEADGKVFFLQNGEAVFEVKGSEIVLRIDPSKGEKFQNPALTAQHSSVPISSDLITVKIEVGNKVAANLFIKPCSLWKKEFSKVISGSGCSRDIHWKRRLADGTEREDLIFLSADDLKNYLKAPEIELPTLPSPLKNAQVYAFDGTTKQVSVLSIEPFMYFALKLAPREVRTNVDPAVLQQSFEHSLSTSGQDISDWLKVNILVRYFEWFQKTGIAAPIASLSQGSGSGKSKLAVEVIKDGPGFYIVLREEDSTGYPKRNALSAALEEFVTKLVSDPTDLSDKAYNTVGIGQIIMLFAKIVTIYLREWYQRIIELKNDTSVASKFDIVDITRLACAEIGSFFDKNDEFDCSFLSNASLEQFISNKTTNSSVKSIATYINKVLDGPANAFEGTHHLDEEIINCMKSCLEAFPFLFVIDEADELNAKECKTEDGTGFEILRRATSYLPDATKIFFLTLGTKSDVHDLNPPILDNSKRLINKTRTLSPITLLSNTSIFSQDTYPLKDVSVNASALKNPNHFKYLVTLGHPLWSSLPFDQIIATAREKIVNGSKDNCDYALVLWMIRAGLMANPTDANTRSLIASHMATVFDFSEDLLQMVVFYPSDPVLAMACRNLLLTNPSELYSKLFLKLDEFFEAVKIDRGNLTEVVGTMTVLLAIDQAESAVDSSKPVSELVDDLINVTNEAFHPLWKKKEFVLEPPNHAPLNVANSFPDYRVVTVREFLKTFLNLGVNEFAALQAKLPKTTLDGIINATHAVKVVRPPKVDQEFKFQEFECEPMRLPPADLRIPDKNCNLIDDAMLRFGLAHQCMYLMPDRYFGFDLIIPIALDDGTFTFLGIQFKSSGTSINEPIRKMQARFHYAKCTGANHTSDTDCPICHNVRCNPEHSEGCAVCEVHRKRSGIYGNQVTLLMSLDSDESADFTEGIYYFTNAKTSLMNQLQRALAAPSESDASQLLKRMKAKTKSFSEPLICKREYIAQNELSILVSSLWSDASVSSKKIDVGSKKIDFKPDGFVHRQYCICTRGVDVFAHLLQTSTALKGCKDLLTDDMHFFKRIKRGGSEGTLNEMRYLAILRSTLYDVRHSYLDYNEVLAAWRNLVNAGDMFGFSLLKKAERVFLEKKIEDIRNARSISNKSAWVNIIAKHLPSKKHDIFQVKRERVGKWKWCFSEQHVAEAEEEEAGLEITEAEAPKPEDSELEKEPLE